MTPETRANMVRRLRVYADWIEKGGDPSIYASGIEGLELCDTEEDARNALELEIPSYSDSWSDGVEFQEWGILVPIEEVKVKAHQADLSGQFCSLVDYTLADPDLEIIPEVWEQECPKCGNIVSVAPKESCPHCPTYQFKTDIWRPTPEDPGQPVHEVQHLKPLSIRNSDKSLNFKG